MRYLTIAFFSLLLCSCKSSKESIVPVSVDLSYAADNSSPNKINFTANISGSYDIIRWSVDGVQVSSGSKNFSQLFPKAGTYKVTLSVWKGLEEFKSEKIVAIEKNLLDFEFTATPNLQNPNLIAFEASIKGNYDKILWNFGNGSSASDLLSTSTTYPMAGTYTVKLSVWSQNIEFDVTKSITISKNILDISISAEPNANDIYKYNLKANLSGSYSNLTWSVQGKTINDLTEIESYFPFKGDYTVTLSAKSGENIFTAKKTISIANSDPDYASKLKLAWSDDFLGTDINTSSWTVETGIHVNNELQTYTQNGNYAVSNGILSITCKKINDAGTYGSYTSARIKTQSKKSFLYGRVEARLRLPKGLGTWPAFWMLGESIGTGTGWPKCGEVDIMEYVGYDPLWVQGSLHSQDFSGGNSKNGRLQLSSQNDESEWHTYGVIWQPDKISFYVDSYTTPYYTYNAPAVKTENNWPYDKPFFIILNLAFGGDWGGAKGIDKTLDNMKFDVDWVKYYSHE